MLSWGITWNTSVGRCFQSVHQGGDHKGGAGHTGEKSPACPGGLGNISWSSWKSWWKWKKRVWAQQWITGISPGSPLRRMSLEQLSWFLLMQRSSGSTLSLLSELLTISRMPSTHYMIRPNFGVARDFQHLAQFLSIGNDELSNDLWLAICVHDSGPSIPNEKTGMFKCFQSPGTSVTAQQRAWEINMLLSLQT